MKKGILSLLAALTVTIGCAQSPKGEQLMEEYSSSMGECTTVFISSAMFRLFSTLADGTEDEDLQEFDRMSKQINGLRILSCERANEPKQGSYLTAYKSLREQLKDQAYESLMSIKDQDSNVEFFVLQKDQKVQELFMLTINGEKVTVIFLHGSISLKDLSSFSKNMSIDGMEGLEKIND